MNNIHAHEVLRMMEGNNYATKERLRSAIVEQFGEEQLFHTCSAQDMNADRLIDFLEAKGKFKSADDNGAITMDITKVCDSY